MNGNIEQIWQNRVLLWVMTMILFVSFFYAGRQMAVMTLGEAEKEEDKRCVVIDAGHGGDDPGKVGVNDVLEKDLNLAVAKRLAVLLEQADIKVVMTREDGDGLYDAGAKQKKVQDMRRRIEIIEETNPDLVVSIHQNSYEGASIRGAQVFFYTGSTEGERLAKLIQSCMVKGLDPNNHRVAKANDSYYLLKKTSEPIVIVECGFLSNPQEAQLLADPDYQERIAWQIHMGILRYLNGGKEEAQSQARGELRF